MKHFFVPFIQMAAENWKFHSIRLWLMVYYFVCLGIQCEWLRKNISQNISSAHKVFVVWQQQTPGINPREKYNNDTSQ